MMHDRTRRGFALPLTIFVIGLLTVMLAVTFSRISGERRVNDDQEAQIDAFNLAQSGLERFLVNRTAMGFTSAPPAVAESARVTMPTGYADVVLERLRPAVGTAPALYVIRSRGVRSGSVPALRTVAMYAQWQPGTVHVMAGWASLTGLRKNGASGDLNGNDNCGAEGPLPAVAVPDGTYSGHTASLQGSPPLQYLGPVEDAADKVKIDWAGIKNGNAITPTITIPGGSWPSSFPAGYWPVIKVNGNFTLPGSGQGTLIVTGDLTIDGNNTWNGIVLVGRNVTSNGDNTIKGATITGLDVKLGPPYPPQGDVGNGNKTFQYDSCNVAAAAANFGGLLAYLNSWMDNWAMY